MIETGGAQFLMAAVSQDLSNFVFGIPKAELHLHIERARPSALLAESTHNVDIDFRLTNP
jgi:hypothetical protein